MLLQTTCHQNLIKMDMQHFKKVVKVVTYSLILIFRFHGKQITSKKMQMFFSCCHFLRLVRQFMMSVDVEVEKIPTELMQMILKKYGRFSSAFDLGNVIIIGSEFFPTTEKEPNWLLIQTPTGCARWVCVFSLPIAKMNNRCFCNPQLYHNLFYNKPTTVIQIFPETSGRTSITCASVVRVSLLNSALPVENAVEKLKAFFDFPKYVQVGDLIEVERDFLFLVSAVETNKYSKKNIGYFVENQKTSLFQLKSLPALKFSEERKLKSNRASLNLTTYEGIHNSTISSQPPCLATYSEVVQRVMSPFVKSFQLSSNLSVVLPTFLLIGPTGSGRRSVIKYVADYMGLHFIEVSCVSLISDSSKASEVRIRNVLLNAQQMSPSILYLTDIEFVGKSREGSSPDCRVLRYFVSEIRKLTELNCINMLTSPMFIVGSCQDSNKCAPDIIGIFLHKVVFNALSDQERDATLRWLLEENSLSVKTSIDVLVRQMHGFRLGDMNTVISIATRHAATNISCTSSTETVIPETSLNFAIDQVRQWQSQNINAPTIPEVRWEDVGGLQHVIKELLDTIQLPLKFPELIQNGLKRSGVLLYGPPGTGKTLLAKAVATECSLHFLSVKGPELLNMYVGQSEENVRNIFQAARQASPCLIFFDELDSLAPNRGRSGDSGGVMDRVVSQLLAELDGINKSALVFVIGATNRPDLIDPALLRPGRFDKLLFLSVNDSKDYQLSVLKALTRKFRLHPKFSLEDVVQQLPRNLTGADLYSLCTNAMLQNVERNISRINRGETISEVDRMIAVVDFEEAAKRLVPSVSAQDLLSYQSLEQKINQHSQNHNKI